MSVKTYQTLHFQYVIYCVYYILRLLKNWLTTPDKNKYGGQVLNMTFPCAKLKAPHFVTLEIAYSLIHHSESTEDGGAGWVVSRTRGQWWELCCVCSISLSSVWSSGHRSIATSSSLSLAESSSLHNPSCCIQLELQRDVRVRERCGRRSCTGSGADTEYSLFVRPCWLLHVRPLCQLSQQPCESHAVLIPILLIRKPRHKRAETTCNTGLSDPKGCVLKFSSGLKILEGRKRISHHFVVLVDPD